MEAHWKSRLLLRAYALILFAISKTASGEWPTSISIPPGFDTRWGAFTSSEDYGCDGGRSVFSCPPLNGNPSQTMCYFNLKSAFGCCDSNNNCQAITTCIPLDEKDDNQTCDPDDHGCTACTDPRSRYCFTITNPTEQKFSIRCDSHDAASTTEFKFTFTGTYTPIPTLANPSARPSVLSTLGATPTSTGGNLIATSHSTTETHLSVSTIVGISFGAIGGIVILALGLWFFIRRRSNIKASDAGVDTGPNHEYHDSKTDNGPGELEAPHVVKSTFDGQNTTSEMEVNDALATSTIPSERQELHGNSPILPPLLKSPGKDPYHAYSNNATNELGQRQYRAYSPGAVATTVSSELDGTSQLSSPVQLSNAEMPPMGAQDVPSLGDQNQGKSSALLATTAGPYLSADSALGGGFWEAEREQIQADNTVESGDEGIARGKK